MFQAIGFAASLISILGVFVWLGRMVYRQAAAPQGYPIVLTGVTLLSLLTLTGVVVLLFLK
jgi:hypothetical protein